MKIYINHFNLEILPNLMNLLKENLIKTETYVQVYSIDGIYKIDSITTKKLIAVDNNIEILNDFYNNYTLIVDKSYFIEEITTSINSDHISCKMSKYIYEINDKSNIKLIIEGESIEDKDLKELQMFKNPTMFKKSNSPYNVSPNNIYFEIPNNININDALIKKEIIVFLSLLN
jgi:hypothetical protein